MDKDSIISRETHEYQGTLRLWKELERDHYVNKDPTSTSLEIRQGHFDGVGLTISSKESAIVDSQMLSNGYSEGGDMFFGKSGFHDTSNRPASGGSGNVATTTSQVPVSLLSVRHGENNEWPMNTSPVLLIQVDDDVSPRPQITQDQLTAMPTETEWAFSSVSPSPVPNGVASDDSQLSESSDLTSEECASLGEFTQSQSLVGSERNFAEPNIAATVSGGDGQGSQKSQLDRTQQLFLQELFKIDKDIPRCDRDYRYVLNYDT